MGGQKLPDLMLSSLPNDLSKIPIKPAVYYRINFSSSHFHICHPKWWGLPGSPGNRACAEISLLMPNYGVKSFLKCVFTRDLWQHSLFMPTLYQPLLGSYPETFIKKSFTENGISFNKQWIFLKFVYCFQLIHSRMDLKIRLLKYFWT